MSIGRSGWRLFENAIFVLAFIYISYDWFHGLGSYLLASVHGGGFVADWRKPWQAREFHYCLQALISLAVSLVTVAEIVRVLYQSLGNAASRSAGFAKLLYTFKPTFMAQLVSNLWARVFVLDLFWVLQAQLQPLALGHVGLGFWGWIYGLLVWDLATWVYHFSTHRVRLLWCLHAPHHSPPDLTITTAWVHFFAETFFTTTVQVLVLTVLGVPAPMLTVFIGFEVGWGTLIHLGERTLSTGRLGWLRYVLITPSYHRVHHAKNPLYMDTNFCTLLPFWDWVFGTLQPLRDEVKPIYGISRPMDVTSFTDFYFGEFIALFRDVRGASNWRERCAFLLKPPGWSPAGNEHTAAHLRSDFLRQRPELAVLHWRAR